ncbi:MAG: DUF3857 domain-containing protein [Balneolaceae bacterium]|nr:DUF3857 domain-containing protein [Balneolaceae bacterium]
MKKILFAGLFVLLLNAQASYSQDISYVTYRNLFPEEDLLILSKSSIVEIKINKNVVEIKEESSERKIYLNEEATRFNAGNVGYNSFETLFELEANTRYLDGTGNYKRKKVSDFETKDVVVNGIFYGDNKSKSFLFPNTSVGSITELNYGKIIKNPRFLNPFYFNSTLETMDSSYEIITDKDVKLGFKLFGDNADNIEYEIEPLKRGKTRHIWKGNSLPKVEIEANSLSQAHYRTHIIPYIEYYITNKGDTVRIAGSVDDLYNWYSVLIDNINDSDNSSLEQFVSELKEQSLNDEELIRTIYTWVQQNINYIAFEDGYGGFIPRGSSLVFDRKYGDCKDMAYLLKTMLQMAGFENVHLAWIGTRERPYSYYELPTPITDNHMIAAIDFSDNLIYLDATNSHTPYGLPSSFIQGKEALIGKSFDDYEILNVPVVEKERNQRIDTTYFTIEGDSLIGLNKRYLSGYRRADIDYALKNISPNKYDDFFNSYLSKGSNKFSIVSIDISGIMEKRTMDAELTYSFIIPNYATAIRNKIYVDPILNEDYVNAFQSFNERTLDYVEDYKFLDRDVVHITIPPGYEIDYLPKSKQSEYDDYGYSLSYQENENEVIVTFEVYHDFLVLDSDKVAAFKDHIAILTDAIKETIAFKRVTN